MDYNPDFKYSVQSDFDADVYQLWINHRPNWGSDEEFEREKINFYLYHWKQINKAHPQ